MSYLDFVKKKEMIQESYMMISEAFNQKNFDKAKSAIGSILRKEITVGKPLYLGTFDLKVDGDDCVSSLYTVVDNKKYSTVCSFTINWLKSGKSMVPYSVCFFNPQSSKLLLWGEATKSATKEEVINTKAQLSIDMMGASIVYYIPVIAAVVNSKKFDLSSDEAVKIGRKVFNTKNECIEYPYYIGAQKYTVYEGMSDEKVNEKFHLKLGHKFENVNGTYEWVNPVLETELEDMKKDAWERVKQARKDGDGPAEGKAYAEYRRIQNCIKGGGETLEDLECRAKRNVSVSSSISGADKASKEIERHKSDPKTAFKEMQMYVKMVIKGIQPAVILCGAPGIGKTYRIMQQLKANGYTMTGDNVIKGKCSPRQLYLTLYNNKGKGDIVVIDDADGLVGPKAPEECINILKAALDSTADDEGRLVSYKITGDLKDDEGTPVPKSCYVKCGVIVITNYGVGQLDSALRNRAFTQSLDFDVKDVLQIVKDLMPNIEPNHLSMTSKAKAMDYLQKLVEDGKPVEVSIRSFITCSRCFENAEDDEELELAQHMIEEQMRNMSLTKKDSKHF